MMPDIHASRVIFNGGEHTPTIQTEQVIIARPSFAVDITAASVPKLAFIGWVLGAVATATFMGIVAAGKAMTMLLTLMGIGPS